MNFHVIRVAFIISTIFNSNAFASFGSLHEHVSFINELSQKIRFASGYPNSYYENGKVYNKEESSKYQLNNGTSQISKRIYRISAYESSYEHIITTYSIIGQLINSEHYIWKNGKPTQVIENNIVRNIIIGKTRCDFTVIESSGDSVYFHLVAGKNKSLTDSDFGYPMRPLEYKDTDKYDVIIFYWDFYCNDYETQIKTEIQEMKMRNRD